MADHWRTARLDVGGFDHPSGLYDGSYSPSNLIPFPSGTPLELRKIGEPPVHQRKLPPGFIFIAALFSQFIVVTAVVVLYLAFRL